RYSHIAGLGPLGSAPTGEVEDYQVLLLEDRPNANDDTDSVLQDSVANPIPVLANDFSSSTGILNITAAGNNGQSANLGVVTISANKQTIFYSPRPGFFGTDTFTYTVTDGANHFDTATVTVTVLPNFENPVAVDDSFSVTEGSSNRLDVLANDIQGRTPPINIVSFGPTLNGGTVQIIEGGAAIQYTPPANFGANVAGDIDQFTYTIADNDVPPNLSTATVTISRNPVDQTEKKVAIVLQPTDLNGRPLGAGEQIQVGQQFQVQVLVDDLRSPLLSLGVESAYLDLLYSATNVQLVDIEFSSVYPNARNRDTTVPGIINELGAVAGFPDPGDGLVELVTLTLQAVAPGTVDFKSDPADDLPLHETVRRASDRVSFEEISYGTASVTITGDVAGGPKAVDDSRSLAGGSIVIPVLANDSQGTGATKELLTVGNVSNGTFVTSNGATVTKNADGTITYNANGFVGTDQFTYTMGNGTGVTSTAEVTVHVGSNINRIADVILEAVNPATGLPITTQIQAGSRFLLNVYVRDNRALPPAESGVFAAYIDLLYDKDRAQVVSSGTNPLGFSVVFGPDFQNQLSGAVVTEGFIDEVGGVGNQTNPGDLSQVKMLLATIEFTATQTGNLVFRADPADIPLTHDFLLYDGDVGALSPSQVDYSDEGVLLLNVVTGQTLSAFTNSTNPLDVNADGTVSPIDVLHVINDLNRGGSRTLQAGSGSPAEGEGGADHLLYIDVNGDSMVSPIDALRVINFLNNRNGGLGEGEFASFVTPDASLDASNSAAASMVVDVVADTAGDTNSLDTSLLSALSTNVATADDAAGDNTSNDSLSDAADTTSAGASNVAQQNRSSQQFDSFDSEADWDSLLTDDMLDDICSAWDESSEDKLFGAL
ncbi:MAG: hypothetical protein KDA59_11810, partial [Planctomycetales bacterium]|nr:hypothetical protein [Planctomycetales bacterium]